MANEQVDTDVDAESGSKGSETAEEQNPDQHEAGEQQDSEQQDDKQQAGEDADRSGPSAGRQAADERPREEATSDSEATAKGQGKRTGRSRPFLADVGGSAAKLIRAAGVVVRVVALFFAFILIAFIALSLVGADTQNGVAQFIGGIADTVVLGFRDLFLIADPTLFLIVGYGMATVFWLVLSEVLVRVFRAIAARVD